MISAVESDTVCVNLNSFGQILGERAGLCCGIPDAYNATITAGWIVADEDRAGLGFDENLMILGKILYKAKGSGTIGFDFLKSAVTTTVLADSCVLPNEQAFRDACQGQVSG